MTAMTPIPLAELRRQLDSFGRGRKVTIAHEAILDADIRDWCSAHDVEYHPDGGDYCWAWDPSASPDCDFTTVVVLLVKKEGTTDDE